MRKIYNSDLGNNDITVVLPVEEPEVELTDVVMTEDQKTELFRSCLRGYGWKG